ncbi:SET domain-containing protein-lysine N-methyltransferase [Candidatus Uhrbacteria bacterium]|nr:SET domain-containing protein-lysine N-methyltransferase [Candidatus Uhrbacteria bacterium]
MAQTSSARCATIIRADKKRGRGVYAVKAIPKGRTIERCEILLIPKKDIPSVDKTFLYNYYFGWKNGAGAIALGNGSLYNHSYTPNARYRFAGHAILFFSLKTIKKGEEITVNYNGAPDDRSPLWFSDVWQ